MPFLQGINTLNILAPNKDAILEHLNTLHGWIAAVPSAMFEVRAIYPDKGNHPKHKRFFANKTGMEQAVSFIIDANKQGYNLYTMVNPVRTGLGERAANGGDVLKAGLNWLDADGTDAEALHAKIAEANIGPVLVVLTGTIPTVRQHVYWQLSQPDDDLAKWSSRQKQLAAHFGTDGVVHDAPRIMRVGGTVSYPEQRKRDRGYITELTTVHLPEKATAYPSSAFDFLPPLEDTVKKPEKPAQGEKPETATGTPAQDDVPLAVLEYAFSFIPASDDRKVWLGFGHAAYEASPTAEGFLAWAEWSQRSAKYDEADQTRTWNSFEPRAGGKTRATIFGAAKDVQDDWWRDGGVVEAWWKNRATAFNRNTEWESMPSGFSLDDQGLWFQPPPDKEGVLPDKVRISDPFKMLYRVRDDLSGEYGTIVEFAARDGKQIERFVPDTLLHDMAGKLATHLASHGLLILTHKLAREKLQAFFNLKKAETAIYTTQSGWVANKDGIECFVLPSGQVLGGDGVIMRPERRLAICEPSGTLAEWQNEVAAYAVGNTRLAFAISLAFAAPLMKLTNTTNGGVNLYSNQSSTGKTTTAKAASSVWGKAVTEGGYINTWRGTDNALEAVIARANDCLLILDEMGEASPETVDKIIYMIGNGTGKARMRQDASLRSNYTWRSLFLSTGEIKAEDKIKQAGKSVTEGIGVRSVNVPALAGGDYGVFDTIHDFSCASDLADHLGLATKKYYGTAIIAFLTEFLKDREANTKAVRELTQHFMKSVADYSGQIRRVAERFALVAAAGELAADWRIVPWELGEATLSAKACFKAWLDDRDPTGDERIIEMVRKYIEANQYSKFVLSGRESSTQAVVHDIAGYKHFSDESMDYHILVGQMDKVVPGVGAAGAAKALDKAGFLVREKGRTTLKFRFRPLVDNMRTEVQTYRISSSILLSE